MARGRPVKSDIRIRIVDILYFAGKAYGYDIYRTYRKIYPKITLRSIYYHLRKGVDLGIFKIEEVQQEKGDYSWGAQTERIFYSLTDSAKPTLDPAVKEFFEKNE